MSVTKEMLGVEPEEFKDAMANTIMAAQAFALGLQQKPDVTPEDQAVLLDNVRLVRKFCAAFLGINIGP